MQNYTVSVIIVNWNHGRFLKDCLEALLAQQYAGLDINVVDNGSTDGSPNWLASHYPNIRLQIYPDNQGFSRAFNQMVNETQGQFVLSLNPDVTARPGFIFELVQAMDQDERIGLVAPKLLRADNPAKLDSTGLFIDRRRRPYDRGQGEIDLNQYDPPSPGEAAPEIFGACGAAALYRRTMLNDLALAGEYFDEDFFAYYEDADLAWRAQGRGWRGVYASRAVATHHRGWGDTLRKRAAGTNNRGPRLALCNRYLMVIKNDTLGYFLLDLPLILMAELPRLVYTAFTVPAALAGLVDLMQGWPAAWSKRRQIRSRQSVSDRALRRWFVFSRAKPAL